MDDQNNITNKKRYPILIIPGFMSSGLEVKESKNYPDWVNKRVWLNVTSIGFGLFCGNNALESNHDLLQQQQQEIEMLNHEEYKKEHNICKSKWLHHMSLSDDMINERSGIIVRPIQGLAGVDYLTPGALELVSYVFGPVIVALNKAGWTIPTSSSNKSEKSDTNTDNTIYSLHAAPYDWRLPPNELQNRDSYFSETMVLIEKMYDANQCTPIILLCHSMGCKTGHYLLNYIHDHTNGGIDWLNKYIYMPICQLVHPI